MPLCWYRRCLRADMKTTNTGLSAERHGMRLSVLLLVAALALSSAQPLQDEPYVPEATALTQCAEAAGGYTGLLLGAAAGWLTGSIMYPWGGDVLKVWLGVGGPAAILGCAGGICGIGAAFRQDGRFLPTLGYAAGSAIVGGGLYYAGTLVKHGDVSASQSDVGFGMTYVGAALVLFAPLIATGGYNQSRSSASYGGRFVPGSVGLAAVRDAGGIVHPALKAHLLTVRF
jgi:hypothetical protein